MSTSAAPFDIELDILGQTQLLQIYTQLTFCYDLPYAAPAPPRPTPESGNNPASAVCAVSTDPILAHVVAVLKGGLRRLTDAFPWVAGQVVNVDGVFRIRPYRDAPELLVRDLRVPGHDDDDRAANMTWDRLVREDFPMTLLDEALLALRRTIPTVEERAGPQPVLEVQAAFVPSGVADGGGNGVNGGLLLTFVGHHACMDITGQGTLIRWLDRACRGESFSEEELRTGNMPRKDVIPLLKSFSLEEWRAHHQFRYQLAPPTPAFAATTSPRPECVWAYFTFPGAALRDLKAHAMATLPSSDAGGTSTSTPPASYISTDDTLTALIWQSVARVRAPRLLSNMNSETETPTVEPTMILSRAISARRFLDQPTDYPGILQNMTYHVRSVSSLVRSPETPMQQAVPLGVLAAELRAALLDQEALAERTSALATLLSSGSGGVAGDGRSSAEVAALAKAREDASFTAGLDTVGGRDLMVSSWADVGRYGNRLTFGLYGYDTPGGPRGPRRIRRPRLVPVEGLVYLMPRDVDDGIAVAVCLRAEDLAALKRDEEWTRWGRWVG